MKRLLLALTLGLALASPSFAQPTDSTNAPPSGPPPGGHFGHGMNFLTEAQKQELHKAHDAAVAANPSLGTQEKELWTEMKAAHESGQPPSDDLKDKMHAFRQTMDEAMVTADPNVAPILAEIKAHHQKDKGGPGGAGGTGGTTPPATSGT